MMFQEALNKSGYKYDLEYRESDQETPSTRKNRPRNSIGDAFISVPNLIVFVFIS